MKKKTSLERIVLIYQWFITVRAKIKYMPL
jgi:hypothetical protein